MKIESLLIKGTIVIALALPACGSAFGDSIYKWVDPSGVVHYTEAPPVSGSGNDKQVQRLSPTDQELERAEEARKKLRRDAENRELQRVAELTALRDGSLAPVPGDSTAKIEIQREILRALVPIDAAENPNCFNHRVIDTKSIAPLTESKTTVERWTLDRCGKRIDYTVTITTISHQQSRLSIVAEK